MCNLEAHRGWLRCRMAEAYRRVRVCALKFHEALGTREICWIVVHVEEIAVIIRDGSFGGG